MPTDAVPLAEHVALAAEARRLLASLRAWRESAGGSSARRHLLFRTLRDRERRLDKLADRAMSRKREAGLFDAAGDTERLTGLPD